MDRFAGLTDEHVLATYVDAERSRADREAAFHELMGRYHRRVFAVCFRVLNDRSDAEDATQETFVKLARNAASFRGEAKLSTWLYRVARNVCTDHVRYDARRPSTPVDDLTTVGDEPVVADLVAARDTALSVQAALARLDEPSRRLLLLVAVDGLSYAEAAAVADLAVGTVKSRISRARVRLGELLADTPDPAGSPSSAGPTVGGADGARLRLEPRGPPQT